MCKSVQRRRSGKRHSFRLLGSLAEALALREGETLPPMGTLEALQATRCVPDFERAMEDACAFMRTHRNAFRELAK